MKITWNQIWPVTQMTENNWNTVKPCWSDTDGTIETVRNNEVSLLNGCGP